MKQTEFWDRVAAGRELGESLYSALWWAVRSSLARRALHLASWLANGHFYSRNTAIHGGVRVAPLDARYPTILYNVRLTGHERGGLEITDLTGHPSTWPRVRRDKWDYDAFGPMQPGDFKPYHPAPDLGDNPGPMGVPVTRDNPCALQASSRAQPVAGR